MITINLLPYRVIPLTQGYSTIVDKEDYKFIKNYDWRIKKSTTTNYVQGRVRNKYGFLIDIALHTFLCTPPEGFEIDHIDGNGLNNRQDNLRIVTSSQNSMNQNKRSKGKFTSKYKGVSRWCWGVGKWRACIWINYKRIHLGYYNLEEEAAKAYNKAAILYHGEYAKLNIIEEENNAN